MGFEHQILTGVGHRSLGRNATLSHLSAHGVSGRRLLRRVAPHPGGTFDALQRREPIA
jgi:hypothetical protein